jgi:hypothetical protein
MRALRTGAGPKSIALHRDEGIFLFNAGLLWRVMWQNILSVFTP